MNRAPHFLPSPLPTSSATSRNIQASPSLSSLLVVIPTPSLAPKLVFSPSLPNNPANPSSSAVAFPHQPPVKTLLPPPLQPISTSNFTTISLHQPTPLSLPLSPPARAQALSSLRIGIPVSASADRSAVRNSTLITTARSARSQHSASRTTAESAARSISQSQ